jgi:TRAP-type C4-dicarboxylate transport system permease small subunit
MTMLRQRLEGLSSALARFEIWAIGLALTLLFLLNATAVISRYVFAYYPVWVLELSSTLMVATVFLGGAWLYRARQQIAVTILVDSLPEASAARLGMRIVSELVVITFAFFVLWQAAVYQPILFARVTTALGMPYNVVSSMIPVAYFSIAVTALHRLLALLAGEDR